MKEGSREAIGRGIAAACRLLAVSIVLRSFYVVTSAKSLYAAHILREIVHQQHPHQDACACTTTTDALTHPSHINSFDGTVKYWKFEMSGRKMSKRKWQ